MIQVIPSVLVHYLDSQTPPVQAELVGQEDRVRPDTYREGREREPYNITEYLLLLQMSPAHLVSLTIDYVLRAHKYNE